MNESERRERIVEYLRIKPISHGQVYTFQIAISQSQVIEIAAERREALRRSLTEQGSNLIPLIVRRTTSYSDEEDYEVVYGADWCIVAKELDIEKLWVWVFDMNDEQAAAARSQMEELMGSANSVVLPISENKPIHSQTEEIKNLLAKLENSIGKKVDNLVNRFERLEEKSTLKGINIILNKQLEAIHQEITTLNKNEALIQLAETEYALNNQLAAIKQEIHDIEKLELSTETNQEEIALALKRVKGDKKAATAIWNAIQHLKNKGRELSWKNLEKLANIKSKADPDKISGFTPTAWKKLQQICKIVEVKNS